MPAPPPGEELIYRAVSALNSGNGQGPLSLAGNLAFVSLADLLQILEVNRKSGSLYATDPVGRYGVIHVRDGLVISADCGPLSGESAVYEMAAWNLGHFAITPLSSQQPALMEITPGALILESLRRKDEAAGRPAGS
ncbi:MAG: hypothetical protein GMKNLPBB_00913 [Myxococcota bacterium]|nr:hypothetical protein [Myxococcota bacterium]